MPAPPNIAERVILRGDEDDLLDDVPWDDTTTETSPVPRPVFERWMAALRFAVYAGAVIIAAAVVVTAWLR